MDLKSLFTDDDAVSPVIGVILMVAITVILAAVIGAFVLDLGGSQESAPQASWSFEYNDVDGDWTNQNDEVTISHEGGQDIDSSTLSYTVGGTQVTSGGALQFKNNEPSDWRAGTDATVVEDSGNMRSGDSVKIIWEASSGDSSNVIAEGEIP